jgi:hypothetical protein
MQRTLSNTPLIDEGKSSAVRHGLIVKQSGKSFWRSPAAVRCRKSPTVPY